MSSRAISALITCRIIHEEAINDIWVFTMRIVDAHTLLVLYSTRAPENCQIALAEWRLDYAERRMHIDRIATLAAAEPNEESQKWHKHCIADVGDGKLVACVCGDRARRYNVYEVNVAARSSRVLGGFEMTPNRFPVATHFADGQFCVLCAILPHNAVGLSQFDVATATLIDVPIDSRGLANVSIWQWWRSIMK